MYVNTKKPREAEGDEQELMRVAKWLQETENLTMGEAMKRAQAMKAEADAAATTEAKKKRLEEARNHRAGWEAARKKFRDKYIAEELGVTEETPQRALLVVLTEIAMALKDISYGMILKSQAAREKKQQQNSNYRKQ